jgi:hypothetical protein
MERIKLVLAYDFGHKRVDLIGELDPWSLLGVVEMAHDGSERL